MHVFWTYFTIILLIFIGKGFGQQVIDHYNFEGNDRYSDSQLAEWGKVLVENMINPLVIESINEMIIDAYQAEGYLYARIDSVVIEPATDENRIGLTWFLSEGKIVRLGEVIIKIDSLDREELDNRLDLSYGDIYRIEDVEAELERISRYFAENGYPLAIINIDNANLRLEDSERFLDISIIVDPGSQIFINRIRIQGNDVTKPEVILREIGIEPKDRYNQDIINAIPGKLNRLGYFNNVNPVKVINRNRGVNNNRIMT